MTALDALVLLLLGGGAMVGFVRGFVHEVLSVLAWVAAIVALKLLHRDLAESLSGTLDGSVAASVVGFALLFVPVFFAVKLLAARMGRRSRRSVLGPIDRVLGGGLGVLKGLIGATFLFLLANYATDLIYGPEAERPGWMKRSRTYPLLNASSREIVRFVEERRAAMESQP